MYTNIEKYLEFSGRPSNGEVQTPLELAQEMVNKLPEEVFTSDKTTFLDPCFGSGTFLKALASKLKEYNHSKENIESRLFGIEKSIRFINKIKHIKGFNPSIINADFLKYDFKDMKFDIVIGNPPYKDPSSGTAQKLWVNFLDKGINIVKPKGYVLYVTPTSWLNTSVNTYKSIHNNNVLYSKIISYPIFGNNIGTSVSYYLIQNTPSKTKQFPLYVSESPSITKGPFIFSFLNKNLIPTKNPHPYTYSILNKVFFNSTPKLKVIRDSRLHTQNKSPYFSKSPTSTRNFELYQSNKVKYYFNPKEVNFTQNQIQEHNLLKIIIPLTSSLRIKNIFSNISCTQNTGWVRINNIQEGENIFSFLNSKLFKYIDFETRVTIGLPSTIIKNLPDIKNIIFNTDQDLYKYFNLTQEEINLIESTIK